MDDNMARNVLIRSNGCSVFCSRCGRPMVEYRFVDGVPLLAVVELCYLHLLCRRFDDNLEKIELFKND